MTDPVPTGGLEAWRGFLAGQGVSDDEAEPRVAAVREEAQTLEEAGLTAEEAFSVAIRRHADRDPLARRFAGPPRRWPSSGTPGASTDARRAILASTDPRRAILAAIGLAVAAAAAVKLPELFGISFDSPAADRFYLRNLSLLILPSLSVWVAWRQRFPRPQILALLGVFLLGAVLINGIPFAAGGSTETLAAIHLPLALWLAVGLVGSGAESGNIVGRRLRFARFTGELLLTLPLLGLGGLILVGLTIGLFGLIGLEAEGFVERWMLPAGAAGAIVIAGFLAETRRRLTGQLAPVLIRVFSPMFAGVLVVFLATMAWTGAGLQPDREVLIGLDLLLVLVVGLVLLHVAARDEEAKPGLFDGVTAALVVLALIVDGIALGAIAGRISEFGPSPNRVAAVGINLILLANLAGSGWLLLGFLRERAGFDRLRRWQAAFLPIYAGWAAFVIAVLPLVFSFA